METDSNVVLNRASSPYRQPFGKQTESPLVQLGLDQAHQGMEDSAGSSSREERQYRTSAYVKQDAPLTIYDESKLHFYSQKIRDYYQNKTGCSEEQDVFQLQRILMPESRAQANTELADKLVELVISLHAIKMAQECIYKEKRTCALWSYMEATATVVFNALYTNIMLIWDTHPRGLMQENTPIARFADRLGLNTRGLSEAHRNHRNAEINTVKTNPRQSGSFPKDTQANEWRRKVTTTRQHDSPRYTPKTTHNY